MQVAVLCYSLYTASSYPNSKANLQSVVPECELGGEFGELFARQPCHATPW